MRGILHEPLFIEYVMTQQGVNNPGQADPRCLLSYWKRYLGSDWKKRKDEEARDASKTFKVLVHKVSIAKKN
jgi:hypothetical protein